MKMYSVKVTHSQDYECEICADDNVGVDELTNLAFEKFINDVKPDDVEDIEYTITVKT